MEESPIVETISLFLSSNELDKVGIQIFTPADQLVSTLVISNYTRSTLQLRKPLPHFYCLISKSLSQNQQFQVKLPDNNDDNLSIYKDFADFSIKMDIQISRDSKNINILRGDEEQKISRLAGQNLKKIQRRIFKRVQLQKLRLHLQDKGNIKKTSIRKTRANKFNLTPNGSQNCIVQKDKDPSRTMGSSKTLFQFRFSDKLDMIEEIQKDHLQENKYSNFLCQKLYEDAKVNILQKFEEEQMSKSIYQKMHKSLLPSPRKIANSKITHKKYLSSLEAETRKQLDKQNIALKLIKKLALSINKSNRVSQHKKQKYLLFKSSNPTQSIRRTSRQ